MFLRQLLSTTVAETIILLYLRSAIGTESVGFRDGFVINGRRISKALIQRIGFFVALGNIVSGVSVLSGGVLEIIYSRYNRYSCPQNAKQSEYCACLSRHNSPKNAESYHKYSDDTAHH